MHDRDPAPLRRGRSATPAGAAPLDCLEAAFLAEVRDTRSLPPGTLPEVAFAGRSNVGKSTLLNRLCQRRGLARTSRTPGCTRGVVLFQAGFRNGARIVLADLPGYGYAGRSQAERQGWKALVEGYLEQRAGLAGVVLLVDARRGLEAEEFQLLEYLRRLGRPVLVVLTKVDKVPARPRQVALAQAQQQGGVPVLGASGETGDGRDALLQRILDLAGLVLPRTAPGPG